MENSADKLEQPAWHWDLLVGVLPLVALSPLLIYQTASLWSRDHMRFFPLVLLAVVIWIVMGFRDATEARGRSRVWTAISLSVVAALIYLYGVWKFSPWLAHLSLLFFFAAWALGRFGQKHWASIAGWTTLLATTLPWPWGWDQGFSNWLQSAAAWCSAKALDALAIPCLQNGSSIETRDLHLVADEVCGGLGSVYAFGAFAILLGLLQHSGFIVGVKTLVLVPLWTLMGHFLRIFGILTLQEYTHRDFSNGWDYRILEVTTAAIVLLLIWCSSRFFRRIFEPIPVADAEFGPVFSGLNKLFCWPQPDPFESLLPDDDYEKQRFLKRRAERLAQQPKQTVFLWSSVPATLWTVRIVPAVLLLAALLPISSLASQGLSSLNFGRPNLSLAQVEGLAGPDSLPDTLEAQSQIDGEGQIEWKKIGFQTVQRNPRSRQGEFSLRWIYRSSEGEFTTVIDLPFLGWNDPIDELELRGWKAGPVDIRWQDDWPWGECELENELGGKETIFYALFTRNGEPYTLVPSRLLPEQATESVDVETAAANQQSATAVTYQFQLLSESGGELSQAGREALRAQFLKLREVARAVVKK